VIQNQDVPLVLNDCKRSKTPVLISSSGLDIAFQTVIKEIDGNTVVLENMVKPEFISRFAKGEKFFLQCKMLRFQSTDVHPRGVSMAFEIQENSLIEETRQSERFMFTPDENVVAEIINPYDGKTKLRRQLMDMSATGLSLRINRTTQPFAPGSVLSNISVAIDGKHWTTLNGEVVYNRKFMDLKGKLKVQVGVKFLTPPKK
jgi:hypothetical protein